MRYELARSSQLELASIFAELQVCTGRCAVEGCVGASHGSSCSGIAECQRYVASGGVCHRSVKVSHRVTANSGTKISCRRLRSRNTELKRARSANRLCPWNRSTTLHVRTGGPSLNAQFSPGMEVHRGATAPSRECVRSPVRYRRGIFSKNGGHHAILRVRISLG